MGEAGERHLLKALETFCIIKALYVDRPLPIKKGAAEAQAVLSIAELSLRSQKTIKRRIAFLIAQGWLRQQADGIHAISWEDLRERYSIRHYRFYHLRPCKAVQLEYLIKAKIFLEKKAHCKLGFKSHLRREALRAEMIKEVSGSLQNEVVAEHQLSNFLSEGKLYDPESSYALSLQYTRRDQEHLNGDLEINYKTTTRIFGYQSDGGAAYMKRTLARKGVIQVHQRRVEVAKGTNTTVKARKTRLGFVLWNKDLHRLELIMPDKVDVIPNAHVDQLHELQNKWRNELKNRLGGAGAQA